MFKIFFAAGFRHIGKITRKGDFTAKDVQIKVIIYKLSLYNLVINDLMIFVYSPFSQSLVINFMV